MDHDSSGAGRVVWRLEDLYPCAEDPSRLQDESWCLVQARFFASKYKGRMSEMEPEEFLDALRHWEHLREKWKKLVSYAYLNFCTRTRDPDAGALWQSAQEFDSTMQRETLFFEREWIILNDSRVLRLLDHPTLSEYSHYLNVLRRYRAHRLSEEAEWILAEKEPTSVGAWKTLFDKVMGNLRFGEERRTDSEVLADLYDPDREIRRQAAEELTQGLKSMSHVLGHIFNTVLLEKSITDRVRKYPHWLRSRNLSNEISDERVHALVAAVIDRFDIVRRYYSLKRRLLGLDSLEDYDRYAPLRTSFDRTFSWEEARRIVLEAYGAFSREMYAVAERFFHEGWIHGPVAPGKRSGAFSHATVPGAHPYVLVNYTGRYRDVTTLAHELGHGIHQVLAGKQRFLNFEVPLTLAETASVFGEILVFGYVSAQTADPAARLALLCGRVEDAIATVFRQVSMYRFEDEVHTVRRTQGELSLDRISEIWMRTQQAMFGDSVRLSDPYCWWWSYIPHFIHSPGYVYAYAFGELLVFGLIQRYRELGSAFVPLYLKLLESGSSASPEDLLKPLGVDLSNKEFWCQGLAILENVLDEAERLAASMAVPKCMIPPRVEEE